MEKGSRSDRALKASISRMYLQGVSTRRVTTVMGELCGFEGSHLFADDIRRIFNAEDRAHAEAMLAEFVKTDAKSTSKLATWTEQNIPKGLAAFSFPEASRQCWIPSGQFQVIH